MRIGWRMSYLLMSDITYWYMPVSKSFFTVTQCCWEESPCPCPRAISPWVQHCIIRLWCRWDGDAENARPENAAPDCRDGKCRTGKCGTNMHGWKMRDLKMRHQTAGVENAGLEIAGPICRGGKCRTGKCRKRHCMERRTLLMST